ncbi:kinase-like domain-containing protein [Clohesyomyces aquaticus]|uniref:Kinase-like domain-containing protein n=1 Tax=Clohesyomyces aquaticus TaxID=1231657 RepID=A0A1Y1ZNA1_9PLEO|nr:kinase-like domain-containing protein [Clohesyomyces aquaticus]
MLHDSGAITPPLTPTKTSHSKSSSASSLGSLSSLRRGDSTVSTGRLSIDESECPGSTALREFKYWISEYEIPDKKKPIGSGLWSDVYLAHPSIPKPSANPSSSPPSSRSSLEFGMGMGDSVLTPPLTPTRARNSSLSKRSQLLTLPSAYAIKVPASRSAKAVLTAEAHILSYLSRFPFSSSHIITFYGQDTRNSALVLKAMDTTLESWITHSLNTLSESARSKKIGDVFPRLAIELLNGLQWMHDAGVVHADIKPSNILLCLPSSASSSSSSIASPIAVYSDFSSALLSPTTSTPNPPIDTLNKPSAPLGGGTWDFLDPTLLLKPSPTSPSSPSPSPNSASDLWALSLTLLTLILGSSPFDCAGSNVFRRRELVKQGCPMVWVGYGDEGLRNLGRLKGVGWDVGAWFEKVLVKEVERRSGVGEWREALERAVDGRGGGARM